MSADQIRFIHAADLHLEDSLRGLASVPQQLRSHLVDAAYLAAEKVFHAAIEHRVDFVLLAGDVMDFSSGDPRSVAFLHEQFGRLQKQGINVYWVGGQIDAPSRQSFVTVWPDNVCYFRESAVQRATFARRGDEVAEIFAVPAGKRRQLRRSDFASSGDEIASLVVAHGPIDESIIDQTEMGYWAFGGPHEHKVIRDDETTAVIAGTTQGRSPQDTQVYGCNLVTLHSGDRLSCRRLETMAFRWRTEQLRLAQGVTRAEIEAELGDRLLNMATEDSTAPTLLTMRLTGGATRFPAELGNELTTWARAEFGQSSPPIWTLQVDVAPPQRFPERWYAEESILGDFLREVERRTDNDEPGIDDMAGWIPESMREQLGSLLKFDSEKEMATALARAAKQGVDLLRGDDAA